MATSNISVCSICSLPFGNNHILINTKCQHTFHQTCLNNFTENNPFCPVCQASVNMPSLTPFRLSTILQQNTGTKRKTNQPRNNTIQTRSTSRLAEIDNNRNLSLDNGGLNRNPSGINNSTLLNTGTVEPNVPSTDTTLKDEITKIYKTIEQLSRRLDDLNISRNFEPTFPQDIFPQINAQPSVHSGQNVNRDNQNINYDIPHLNYVDINQSRNNNTVSSIALTNSSKVASVINSWNIKFDGNSSSFPVGKFLYVITALTNDNLGGDFQLLCDHFQILLSGRAKEWYWRYRSSMGQISWRPLSIALRSYFSDHLSDNDIREMIRERKQLPGESYDNYYADVLKLCDRLRYPLLEEDLVEMLKRNLRPQLRRELFYITVTSLAHLRHLILRREVLNNELENKYNLRPTQKHISELELDDKDEELLGNVSTINKNSNITCWNCKKQGHAFVDCLEERSIFCYGCGTENVFKPNCTQCKNQGNLNASGFRSKK